jgi:hypothetical protein
MSERKDFPGNFRRIRLELARERDHPGGEHAYGYTLVAPLDDDSRIDLTSWKSHAELCRVVRFRPDGEKDIGHLRHSSQGVWTFHYDIAGDDDDETAHRLGEEHFTLGEYISVKSKEGMHTYKVVSVEPI